MNDTQVFIAGMFIGVVLCYLAGLLKSNSPTHINFTIDYDSVKRRMDELNNSEKTS